MRRLSRLSSIGLALATLALFATPASAQESEQVKIIFERPIPNVEGKSMVTAIVSYPPGGKSAAHHHAPSAFIYAYVLSGSIRSKVGNEPVKVYKAGESFYEEPGSHHTVARMQARKSLQV